MALPLMIGFYVVLAIGIIILPNLPTQTRTKAQKDQI